MYEQDLRLTTKCPTANLMHFSHVFQLSIQLLVSQCVCVYLWVCMCVRVCVVYVYCILIIIIYMHIYILKRARNTKTIVS